MTERREFKFARVPTVAVYTLAEYEVSLGGVSIGRVAKVEHTFDANRHNGGPRGNARMVTKVAWRALGDTARRREFCRSSYYATRREAADALLEEGRA